MKGTRHSAIAAALWAGLIFLTSCTVIFTDTVYGWIHALGFGSRFDQAFQAFWEGGGGLLLVKGWHFTEFAILYALVFGLLKSKTVWPTKAQFLASWVLTAMFALSDEWHQTFVAERHGNWRDVVIDLCGATFAALMLWNRERAHFRDSSGLVPNE